MRERFGCYVVEVVESVEEVLETFQPFGTMVSQNLKEMSLFSKSL
jgi:hypothetical protein